MFLKVIWIYLSKQVFYLTNFIANHGTQIIVSAGITLITHYILFIRGCMCFVPMNNSKSLVFDPRIAHIASIFQMAVRPFCAWRIGKSYFERPSAFLIQWCYYVDFLRFFHYTILFNFLMCHVLSFKTIAIWIPVVLLDNY